MNKIKSGLLAVALLTVGFNAAAADLHPNGPGPHSQRQHSQQQHNAVYQSSIQTENPNESLKKLAADAPTIEQGKSYYVRVGVADISERNLATNKPINDAKNTKQRDRSMQCDQMRNKHNSVYQASVQTTDPNGSLKKLVADTPALATGKPYQVRVSIVEARNPPVMPAAVTN
ncbi:hypothetical protein [Moellerella wisconsensis]|uniref:Uncharacterized protein n=1 Tax=Moellerella wisconsensis ATCC 35017 TaxID=1354267 RepID=A0A0N0I9P4_9GAMM|nr:hypothetical protein [Moellerella wisconsensis]KPD02230.1 hypothetical protein M992_2224 [Moellerella wisconsensis ATCC 35017]VFS53883.1 Uncharacterised protein [Moellerella wisconsensis]